MSPALLSEQEQGEWWEPRLEADPLEWGTTVPALSSGLPAEQSVSVEVGKGFIHLMREPEQEAEQEDTGFVI